MHLNIFPLLSHFLIFVNVYCDTTVYRVNLPSHRAVLSSVLLSLLFRPILCRQDRPFRLPSKLQSSATFRILTGEEG